MSKRILQVILVMIGLVPLVTGVWGHPLGSLQQLGLVDRLSQHHVYLRATAFERANYERKSRLGKWWMKKLTR